MFTRLVIALCLLAAIAGLVAGFLGHIWLPLDALSHFRPHFAGLVSVSLVCLFLRRFRFAAFVLGVLAVPLVVSFAPYHVLDPPAGKTGLRPFKLLSFNTWLRARNWRETERYILKTDPDFVMLIEFGASKRPLLRRLKARYPWQSDCTGRRACQLAFLSKHRWRQAVVDRGRGWKSSVITIRFGPKFSGLTIMGTHLVRPPWIRAQAGQIERIAARAARVKGPLIFAGDFNATPHSLMFRRFTAKSRLRSAIGPRPSWPVTYAPLPQLPIDHIFVSRHIAVLQAATGPRLGSDHLPVTARLAIRGGL
jgi:endonuclease/exonuclease/phosphatase (EEP) superfamily protein YafD